MIFCRYILILVFQACFIGLFAQTPFQYKIADKITESWRWTSFDELRGRSVRCMTEGANGVFWFGVEGGIMHYSGYNWTMIPFPDSLTGISVTALCEGTDGSVWTGTDAGLFVLRDSSWQKVFPDPELDQAIVNDIIRLPGGSILAGITESGDESLISGLLHIGSSSLTLYASAATFQYLNKQPGRRYNLQTVSEKLTIKNRKGEQDLSISDLHIKRVGNIPVAL